MDAIFDRLPRWADWIVALVVGVALMNLNVTSAGDPLSGVGLEASTTSPGITEGARTTFYAVMALGGLLFVSLGIGLAFAASIAPRVSRLLMTTYSLVALAGVLGLLFDYRDGPVRLVQLFAYVTLALGIVRFGRVARSAIESGSAESDAMRPGTDDTMTRSRR